jgi:hypothetical protein
MQRFKSSSQAQEFLPARGDIYGHVQLRRRRMTAAGRRRARTRAFWIWRQETCVQHARWVRLPRDLRHELVPLAANLAMPTEHLISYAFRTDR